MNEQSIEEQVQQLCNLVHSVNRVYEEYARSVDIPYTTLEILDDITMIEDCTQKKLRECTFLPKQTVNNVITAFYRKGLIELREVPSDRRNKTIHLTEKGKEYVNQYIPQIRQAEYEAMRQLTPEQREGLLEGMRVYSEIFHQVMPTQKKGKEENNE